MFWWLDDRLQRRSREVRYRRRKDRPRNSWLVPGRCRSSGSAWHFRAGPPGCHGVDDPATTCTVPSRSRIAASPRVLDELVDHHPIGFLQGGEVRSRPSSCSSTSGMRCCCASRSSSSGFVSKPRRLPGLSRLHRRRQRRAALARSTSTWSGRRRTDLAGSPNWRLPGGRRPVARLGEGAGISLELVDAFAILLSFPSARCRSTRSLDHPAEPQWPFPELPLISSSLSRSQLTVIPSRRC